MEELDVTGEDLKQFADAFIKESLCVRCKQQLTPPVSTCQEGHFACNTCWDHNCCICESPTMDVDLSSVTDWLKLAPRRCSYASRGCTAVVLPTQAHERFCGYSYQCQMCDAEGHIVRHFKAAHKEFVAAGDVYASSWEKFGPKQTKFFVINNAVFKLKAYARNKAALVTEVYCLYTRESAGFSHYYSIEYSNGTWQYSFTGKVLDSRTVYPTDDENFMRVPSIMLPFLLKDDQLCFTIKIRTVVAGTKLKDTEGNKQNSKLLPVNNSGKI